MVEKLRSRQDGEEEALMMTPYWYMCSLCAWKFTKLVLV